MQRRYSHTTQATWLFITGALSGACQKPAAQHTTPESTPPEHTTNTPNSFPSASAERLTPVPTAIQVTASQSNTVDAASAQPHGSWPNALPGANASTSSGSSTFQGCLSKSVGAQNKPTRSRKMKAETTFRVTPLGNGALVTHTFEHACCLSATTTTTTNGNAITVEERLVGTPCRCVCDSTIQTRIGAPPGDYEVRLVLNTNGVESLVGVQPLSVQRTIDRSP
jgi:hypothetical protein